MSAKSPYDLCDRCGKLRRQVGVLLPHKDIFLCDRCIKERNLEILQEFGAELDDEALADGLEKEGAGPDGYTSMGDMGDMGDDDFDDDFDDDDEIEELRMDWAPKRFNPEKLNRLFEKSDVRKIDDLSLEAIDPHAVNLIPKAVAEQFCIIPIKQEGSDLTVAFSDPSDEEALHEVQYFTSLNVNVVVADEIDIEEAIERYYEP